MRLLGWLGLGLGVLVAIVVREVIRDRLHFELYERGRTPTQIKVGNRYHAFGVGFFLLMLVADWLHRNNPPSNSTVWAVVFWSATAGALYCALRASALTSMRRTIAAFAAVLAGMVLLAWGFIVAPKLGSSYLLGSVPIRVGTVLIGALMLYAAVRLARPPRAPA